MLCMYNLAEYNHKTPLQLGSNIHISSGHTLILHPGICMLVLNFIGQTELLTFTSLHPTCMQKISYIFIQTYMYIQTFLK